jgi:hypothetical protein
LLRKGPFNDEIAKNFAGHWAFLTVVSLAVTWLTFVVALVGDFTGPNSGIQHLSPSLIAGILTS